MTETIWFLVVGGVLIFMGLASSTFKRLPISTAMCYLAIGFALGPGAANLLHIRLDGDTAVLRLVTEVGMLVSLFAIGLRLRVPPTDRRWLLPLRLGFVAMALTIVALTLLCGYALGMAWGRRSCSRRCSRRPIPSSPTTCRWNSPATPICCVSR